VDSLGRIAAASVIEHLRDADMLIVFDNCEHVIQRTAEFVQMLLGRCHRVRVLATSREPLLFPGERVWSVPTLAFPDEGVREISDIVRYPAVRLFVERAEDVSDQFSINARNADDIVSLCRRLDGIPLALELAAVMVSSMDIGPLVSALDQRFSLLTSGNRTTLPRHRTLRGVVDWGYELLAEPERLLLRRLAVFTGAWMLEDAAVVCTGPGDVTDIGPEDVKDLLPHLVRKSFVVFEAATQTHRLLETIRQYALEKLDATGELVDLRNRHMHHYYRRIQDTGGDIEPIRGLVSVLTNIRAAMDWSIDAAEADVAVDFCKFIAWFASSSHLQAEGSARFETLLRRSDFDGPSRHRMHSLQILGWFSTKQADIVAARKYFAECVDVCHTIGELDFIPTVLTGRVETEIVAGDLPAALKFACECLEITPTTTEKYGLITTQVGALYEMNGDADSAVDMLTRSLQFWESFDPKHDFKNLTTIQLASAYSRMGRLDEARHIIGAYLTDAMAVNYGYYGVDAVLVGIRITYAMGRTERAAATVSMLIHFASELGWLKSWELRPDFDELRKTVMSGLSDRQLAAIDAEAVCTDWHSICAAVIKEIA
jgi:predicted ATPase